MTEILQHRAFLLAAAAGAAWGLANLWGLSRALRSWLGPQPAGRAVQAGWFLLKFPLLYGAAIWLLTRPGFSAPGFGAGFSLALLGAVAVTLRRLAPALRSARHGG